MLLQGRSTHRILTWKTISLISKCYENLIKNYNSTFKNDENISFTLIFDLRKCYISFCYRENGEWNCSPWQEVPCEINTEDLILESEKIE